MMKKNSTNFSFYPFYGFLAFFLMVQLCCYFWVQKAGVRFMFISSDALWYLAATIVLGGLARWFNFELLLKIVIVLTELCQKYRKIVIVSLTVFAFLVLAWVNREVLHQFMNSADEHSCYFLAKTLDLGRFWVEPHPLSDFFNVVHVGNRDGKWFSVYPPGWPLLWLMGMKVGLTHLLNPLLTALSIPLLYLTARKIYGVNVAIIGILFLTITPFFLFTGASYFSHSASLFMISLFSFSFLKWKDAHVSKQRVLWVSVAAFAVGYGLMTRYLTMAAFAGPFLLVSFWPVLMRKERIRKDHIIAIGIILFFLCVVFYQNYDVTGKPFKAPNRFDKSWEKLGFRDFYTPLDAMLFFIMRFFYLTDWAAPFFAIMPLFLLYQMRRGGLIENLFRYSFFYPVVAYFFYFSWGGNQYGPRYYYEGFPFLIFACFSWLKSVWAAGEIKNQKAITLILVVSIFASGHLFLKQAHLFDQISRERKVLYDSVEESVDKPAVVFIKGFLGDKLVMAQDDAIRNEPDLDSEVLYAHDRGEENQKLMEFYPARNHYQASFDRNTKRAIIKPL